MALLCKWIVYQLSSIFVLLKSITNRSVLRGRFTKILRINTYSFVLHEQEKLVRVIFRKCYVLRISLFMQIAWCSHTAKRDCVTCVLQGSPRGEFSLIQPS